MKIITEKLSSLTSLLSQLELLTVEEINYAATVSKNDFPFANQIEIADSMHYHIHVTNVAELPNRIFLKREGIIANKAEGYIKYAFDGGINFIFSHIPVAQKEKIYHAKDEAYLDHIGIDIRSDDKPAYVIFQQIPLISSQHDYLFTRQGDGKEVVKCCNIQVKEKYWVYPNEKINYEFSFGPLVIHEGGFGIDLRPANPFNTAPVEELSSCCSSSTSKAGILIN